jgi:hypothetical protein
MMSVMLLWVCIHNGQAWKICLHGHGGKAYFSSLPGAGYTLRVTSQTSYKNLFRLTWKLI